MPGRVVFFADQIAHWNAGTERQLLLLGTELSKLGWSVPLYALKRSDAVVDGSWPDEVVVLEADRVASPTTWIRVFRVALAERRKGATVAHCYLNDVSIVVPPTAKLAGLKVVISRRDMGFWYSKWELRVLRTIRRFVDRVVANANAVKDVVTSLEGYLSTDVSVIYNGIVDAGMTKSSNDSEKRVVGIVANIRPIKRLGDAVRAFSIISGDFPDAVLRIVGGGDATELKGLAQSLGISERVEFAGRTADPSKEMSNFTVGVLTSESEGLSNTIIEYMLHGLPVVCTDTGGNPELITHDESGLLVQVGNVDELANCLRRMLVDQVASERMADRARVSVLEICSTEKMVQAHVDLYRALAA